MKKSFIYVLYIVSYCVKVSSWSMSTQGSEISMITKDFRLVGVDIHLIYITSCPQLGDVSSNFI